MARTASNGIVFRQAESLFERGLTTARCLSFDGAPGCLPWSETGLPKTVLADELVAAESSGKLAWTIALDGGSIVGGSAYTVHSNPPEFHVFGVVTWLADEYRTEQNQRNLWYQTLLDAPQPGCCGNRWAMVAPTNGLDLAIAKEVSKRVSEEVVSPVLTRYIGVPNLDSWALV